LPKYCLTIDKNGGGGGGFLAANISQSNYAHDKIKRDEQMVLVFLIKIQLVCAPKEQECCIWSADFL
jgi:hypothetical protein